MKHTEKKGGRRRTERSFGAFRSFITAMEMGEVQFRGDCFTWANNREQEGFIQKRLDHFFGSKDWILLDEFRHVVRQAPDHFFLLLDSQPQRKKSKSRFFLIPGG